MKRILALLLLCSGVSYAVDPASVNRSSFVAGGTHTACIQASYIDKIQIGATTATGSLIIYDSSFTTTGVPIISSVALTAGIVLDLKDTRVKGICYVAANPLNGATIIYKK